MKCLRHSWHIDLRKNTPYAYGVFCDKVKSILAAALTKSEAPETMVLSLLPGFTKNPPSPPEPKNQKERKALYDKRRQRGGVWMLLSAPTFDITTGRSRGFCDVVIDMPPEYLNEKARKNIVKSGDSAAEVLVDCRRIESETTVEVYCE